MVRNTPAARAVTQPLRWRPAGSDREIDQGLVKDHRIKAVRFTGSRSAGTDLISIAAARKEPIPVYAEMSGINAVLLFSGCAEESR
jgi:NADP-dependent aldehyde dehydrogenase